MAKKKGKAKTEEKANPYTGPIGPGNLHQKDSKGIITEACRVLTHPL